MSRSLALATPTPASLKGYRNFRLPKKFGCLFTPKRYKVFYGGRGAAKSWSIARALIVMTARQPLRVLCTREYQSSITDSVHKLLVDQIWALGLQRFFVVTQTEIRSLAGAQFIFKGLAHSVQEIKSTEGIDIAWVEEAQSTSAKSWEILTPTIRKPGSEIWISFNPAEESDPTYQKFVLNPPPNSFVVKVNWSDNPWFKGTELDAERLHTLATDQELYDHIWGGEPRTISDAVIFAKRAVMGTFETPEYVDRFFYGADWGFANDPTALVRSFIQDDTLFIDQEVFGHGVELDELPQLFDSMPGSREWPIKADSSRPETISYMRRQGFAIDGAEKWPGSVEDGITHLKGFKRIVIHERCTHMDHERKWYRYKVDKKTGDILPIIVDAHNHGWDSVRYGLDGYIQRRGSNNIWERLAA